MKTLRPWRATKRAMRMTLMIGAAALLLYELREWHDDRLTRNWQILATPAPGNSGKIAAMEYLNSKFLCLPFEIELPLIGRCWKDRAPLAGIDLSAKTHRGRVFLDEIQLPNADLSRATLAKAILWEANLLDADLTASNLSEAILYKANLSATEMWNANLRNADMTATNLSNAALEEADLSEAFLRWANLFNAGLREAKLNNANLTNTNLTETDLSDADLTGANLIGTNLTDAVLNNANLNRTKLHGANLKNADLTNASLTDANLTEANLTEADLINANLTRTILTGANLTDADLTNASLTVDRIRGIWAFSDSTPHGVPDEISAAIALRYSSETWPDFVDRIMRDRPELGLKALRKHIFRALIAVLILVSIGPFLWALLLHGAHLALEAVSTKPADYLANVSAKTDEQLFENVRNLGLIALGIIGMVLAVWRSVLAYQQNKTSIKQANIAEKGLIIDRFQKGAQMLESGELSVRLAGIYALRELVWSDPKETYIIVLDLLFDFVRERSKDRKADYSKVARNWPHPSYGALPPDLQKALETASRLRQSVANTQGEERRKEWNPDLRNANLSYADLSGAILTNANLSRAVLTGASLSEADLFDADLSHPNLSGAELSEAMLSGAKLTGIALKKSWVWEGTPIEIPIRDTIGTFAA
eukprot:g1405.t1